MKNRRKKTLVVISGGIEAVPVIGQAKAMGLRVAVVDGDPGAPGFELADERIVASTYDPEAVTRLVIKSDEKNRIHGVLAAAADVPGTVAAVAHALGLPGPSFLTAFLATDKLAMKQVFRDSGVPVPWFGAVDGPEALACFMEDSSRGYVVKPVDSRGARGVVRLVEGVDPGWAYEEALRHSPTGRVMVEEWVEGRQVSTESVVFNGRLSTPGLSDRNYEELDRFSPFVIEDGGDLPARLTDEELAALDAVLLRVAGALGLERGTLKGDIIIGPEGPVVVEAAVRLSGGYFATHTIPLSTGVNIVEAAIRIALGEELDPDEYAPKLSRHVCQRFVFPEPGVVTSLKVDPDVYALKELKMLSLYLSEGDTVSEMKSHPCRSGMVIATGSSREAAREVARAAVAGIRVKTGTAVLKEA